MKIDDICVNELRVLSNEMITNAKSGHPGIALGAAPIIYSLYANVLNASCKNEKFFNRDRFVLSAGHGSSVLYATLHAMGYNITNNDLKEFRKIGSKTPGHPEVGVTEGIDASTGPLGQGVSNAVGMAIAEKHFEAVFNKKNCKLFDSKVFCMVGDGCLMEGISYEALSLVGNLNLNNFVLIYDCNKITIEGKIDLTFSDDIDLRFRAIGFEVFKVEDGNSISEITKVLLKAKKSKKPSIVIVPTTIGYGTELEGNQKIHGSPLTDEMLEKLKQKLNVTKPSFEFSEKVLEHFKVKIKDAEERLNSKDKLSEYKKLYPNEYKLFRQLFEKNNFEKEIEKVKTISVNGKTTREINFEVLNKFAEFLPSLFGGSADVATSTQAYVKSDNSFSKTCYSSKFMHYGVREHAMAGISNGLALFGGLLPYQSCFLAFYDYLKPALRMSALQNLRVLSIFSHDCLTAGQDGPTHQPIEQLPSLRMIPNTIVSRPYNSAEIIATYIWLLQNNKPVCMLVSKDKMDIQESEVADALMGGYIIKENKDAQITIVATGCDVDRCLKAEGILQKYGICARFVSMPCISIFEMQPKAYRKQVLKDLPTVFVEASAENIWYKFAKEDDLILNINKFGKSGSPDEVLKHFGLDTNGIVKKILSWIKSLN
ncbi:MAG TPA: transketolase [Clostridiales bacterium]|nr:transketolase [Clostridiales bacterium]